MIVTVTPNPSIDRTLRIPRLDPGGVIRAMTADAEAGGKGLNVSRSLAIHGHQTVAVAPLSSASATTYQSLVRNPAPLEVVPIAGDIRVNISLVESDGRVTKVNEPGPELTALEVEAMIDRVAALAESARWVVGAGSLPRGVGSDFYARLAKRLPDGVRLAVDTEGEPLRAALDADDGHLALIKPNRDELEGVVGRELSTLGDVVDAARQISRPGLLVLVSLGSNGAILVERDAVTHADGRIDDVVNTVGAGDALLAGFLAGGAGAGALKTAVAWSVAACRSPGTQMRRVAPADESVVAVHAQAPLARLLVA